MSKYVLVFILSLVSLFAEEKTYVTCMLWGELGNQMFEIANATAYGLDHQCEPVFFGFSEAAAGNLNLQYVFQRVHVLTRDHGIKFIDYHHSVFTPLYAPIPYEPGKNIRILGHYQNERYFVHHKDDIMQLFAPSEEILQIIQRKYGSLLNQHPIVGLHIRTFIPSARHPDKDGFGGATWEYFINAINYFPEDYTFLIFSDDPGWVKKNFPPCTRKIRFIEGNPHYIDLYFMSLCDHQIISPESTFSWWAAWLNKNPEKIVIAPHFWQGGYKEEDAFPPDWIRIDAPNQLGY